jgi:hypothetical protein
MFPALVGYCSTHMPLGSAIALFAVSAYVIMAFSALLLPETSGTELND